MSEVKPKRIIVFGATGHLGQELVARLDDMPGAQVEVVGVVSEASTGAEFEFRGELLDAESVAPTLRSGDLVFVCTPEGVSGDVVRAALLAGVPCIDCSGVMAQQAEVMMPVLAAEIAADVAKADSAIRTAPLLALPSAATLAWAPILDALSKRAGLTRLVATTLQSASVLGRNGLVALSEESIALFNQSEIVENGPAGQAVAFDVIPNATSESRTAAELGRLFDSKLRLDLMNVQVPTFVGEGASLSIELAAPLSEAEFAKTIDEIPGVRRVEDGIGTRGLVPVDTAAREPTGPTLRDAAGAEEILIGGIRPDASLPAGQGWRVWLSYDPARRVAIHAIQLASIRFPGS